MDFDNLQRILDTLNGKDVEMFKEDYKSCDKCGTRGIAGEIQEAEEGGPEMCAECFEDWQKECYYGWFYS